MVVRKEYWVLAGDGEVAWKYEMWEGEEEEEGAFYGCSVDPRGGRCDAKRYRFIKPES